MYIVHVHVCICTFPEHFSLSWMQVIGQAYMYMYIVHEKTSHGGMYTHICKAHIYIYVYMYNVM